MEQRGPTPRNPHPPTAISRGPRGRGGGEGVRTRDHLANVRTTLAWVRTGMVLIGIGYGADKLAAVDTLHGVANAYGRPVGLVAVLAGVTVAAAALPRFL